MQTYENRTYKNRTYTVNRTCSYVRVSRYRTCTRSQSDHMAWSDLILCVRCYCYCCCTWNEQVDQRTHDYRCDVDVGDWMSWIIAGGKPARRPPAQLQAVNQAPAQPRTGYPLPSTSHSWPCLPKPPGPWMNNWPDSCG